WTPTATTHAVMHATLSALRSPLSPFLPHTSRKACPSPLSTLPSHAPTHAVRHADEGSETLNPS
ncbi:MAG: hypothetical protein K2K55_04850, partial [Duncaniella sp.]|nr:hypothetical protein [Duncaniella sp.]